MGKQWLRALATCSLCHFCCRHLQLCLQAALRARQTPWGAQKSWRALRRSEGKKSSLWLTSELPAVGGGFPYLTARWDGKVCRLSPGQGAKERPEEKAGVGRGERKPRRRKEEEASKRLGDGAMKRCRKVPQVRKPRWVPGSAAHPCQLSTLL